MWANRNPYCFVFLVSAGITYDVKRVYSQPQFIQRQTDRTPDEAAQLEEDIHKVIDQIHSLSGGSEDKRSFSTSTPAEDFDLNAYYNAMGNVYALFQPLLREGFVDDLPRTVICILSGRQDCGLEAELTKTVSLEVVRPLLTFVSSLRSQMCSPLNGDGGPSSFLRAYLRMGEPTSAAFSGFQETFINILSGLPLSGNLLNVVSRIVDSTVTYVSKFMASFLQAPMDYIKIALQFGIRIPSLDGREVCEQGKHGFSLALF